HRMRFHAPSKFDFDIKFFNYSLQFHPKKIVKTLILIGFLRTAFEGGGAKTTKPRPWSGQCHY
ncbi:MAG: hypothetical protein AAF202_04595, partial [Pseudomonadota bacterium]